MCTLLSRTPLTYSKMFEKKELMCSVCYCKYGTGFPQRIPRDLDCKHTYCTECITKIRDLQGDVIECPTCKLRTLLSSDGVEGLSKNFDVLSAVFESEKEKEQICNFCVSKVYPPKPARFFCTECSVYSCGNCSDEIHSQIEFRTHDVCLASSKGAGENDVPTRSRPSSVGSTNSRASSNLSKTSSHLLNYSLLPDDLKPSFVPECPEHKDKLKFYCRTCNVLCCGFCNLYGSHMGHSCFEVHEAEERERKILETLQATVEKQGDKYIKARGDVQRTIEDVKQGAIVAKDTARRYFRELRAAIEQGEQLLMQEISKRSEAKLKALNEQVSEMIEISSRAKTASRSCDKALGLDYYEMLTRKHEVENEIREVLGLSCETTPAAQANLKCQFPNHEVLLNKIKTCAKLVVPPGPPEKLSCQITDEKNVLVKWNPPDTNFFLYPVVRYVLQSSIGPNNSFVEIYKGCDHTVTVDRQKLLPKGQHVQFRSSAINTVGQGPWSFAYGIKIPS